MAAEQKMSIDDSINKCDSISKCQSLQRITTALHFFQSMKNDPENMKQISLLTVEYFTKYKTLLDDYAHVMKYHINAGTIKDNNDQFEQIHNYICKHIKCDIKTCQQFIRNNRNRTREKTKNDANNNDKNAAFYIDILDTIHCYLIHSFDVGFRIKSDEFKINNNQLTHDEEEQIDNENIDKSVLYKDDRMEKLKTYLVNKRKGLDRIAGLHRLENSKFMTTVTEPSKLHERVPIERKTNDKNDTDDTNEEDTTDINRYSFGKRMYYWDKYIDNEWYVKQKFPNLKQEILNNKMCTLNIQQYELVLHKAMQYSSTDFCKSMLSCYTNHSLYYDIRGGLPIGVSNLLSILLYTDYSKLCYEFSKTFRKLNNEESNCAMKKRNSEYFNWSKLMRETVEYWGEPLWKTEIKIFYSGCSYMILEAFIANFCGPTSTSTQLQVAAIFAKNDGIILELQQSDSKKAGHLRYFNCSLFSCYASEDERLFCGGNFPLSFHSIRLTKYNHNYQHFVEALRIFNEAMNGKRNRAHAKDITKTCSYIVTKLIKYEMKQNKNDKKKDKFPDYIYALFDSFCDNKTIININTVIVHFQYGKIMRYFVKNSNFVLIDNIVKLFPNCDEIHIRPDSSNKIQLNKSYMESLLILLTKVNKMRKTKQPWKEIVIHNIKRDNKQNIDEFRTLFKKINWDFKVEKSGTFATNNLIITPLEVIQTLTINKKKTHKQKVNKKKSKTKHFERNLWGQ